MNRLEEFINQYLNTIKNNKKNNIIILDKLQHIENTAKIANQIDDSNKLLEIAMKFHDIGRFKQYSLIQSFDDNIVSHKNLGEETIAKLLEEEIISPSFQLDQIRLVIQYHGNWKNIPFKEQINKETINLVKKASDIDALENGCLGVTRYLEREILNDEKNYKMINKTLNMKQVSDELWYYYENKKRMPKKCKTYADYVIYAASLAITSLIGENQQLAKDLFLSNNNEYGNTLDWYKHIFTTYLDKNYTDKAFEILKSAI